MCFLFKSIKTMLWRHHNIYVSLYWTTLGLLFHRCYKSRTHFPSCFSQNNIDIDLTYTKHNLNNVNKYPSITCSYIQEYLGYWSNNLNFLFSHSWPVVEYNFGQVQRTSQVERKNKMFKKTTTGDIAVFWTVLYI